MEVRTLFEVGWLGNGYGTVMMIGSVLLCGALAIGTGVKAGRIVYEYKSRVLTSIEWFWSILPACPVNRV